MATENRQSVADTLRSVEKKYGLRVSSLMDIAEDVQAYTTGNLAIDHIIGVGGLPVGRSVELFGPPSCGKTTTALQAMVALQRVIKRGGNADPTKGPLVGADDRLVYFDYEHAMDPLYVTALGLDLDHPSFLFAQPDTLEAGANAARDLIDTGMVRMVVWDSVAAALPSAKADADIGKSLPAIAAKLYADFTSSVNEPLHRNNCTMLWINHVMELMDMGRRPGMPARTSTPGGRALKFYASVRVEYQQVKNIKHKTTDDLTQEEVEQVAATDVRVRVIKNKVAAPFRQANVRVRYGRGFDNFWSAMQVLIAHKKVVASAGYFYFERSPELAHEDMPRQATGTHRPNLRGERVLFQFSDAHPEWRELCIELARQVLTIHASVAPELPDDLDGEEPDLEAALAGDESGAEPLAELVAPSPGPGRRVALAKPDDSEILGIDQLLTD